MIGGIPNPSGKSEPNLRSLLLISVGESAARSVSEMLPLVGSVWPTTSSDPAPTYLPRLLVVRAIAGRDEQKTATGPGPPAAVELVLAAEQSSGSLEIPWLAGPPGLAIPPCEEALAGRRALFARAADLAQEISQQVTASAFQRTTGAHPGGAGQERRALVVVSLDDARVLGLVLDTLAILRHSLRGAHLDAVGIELHLILHSGCTWQEEKASAATRPSPASIRALLLALDHFGRPDARFEQRYSEHLFVEEGTLIDAVFISGTRGCSVGSARRRNEISLARYLAVRIEGARRPLRSVGRMPGNRRRAPPAWRGLGLHSCVDPGEAIEEYARSCLRFRLCEELLSQRWDGEELARITSKLVAGKGEIAARIKGLAAATGPDLVSFGELLPSFCLPKSKILANSDGLPDFLKQLSSTRLGEELARKCEAAANEAVSLRSDLGEQHKGWRPKRLGDALRAVRDRLEEAVRSRGIAAAGQLWEALRKRLSDLRSACRELEAAVSERRKRCGEELATLRRRAENLAQEKSWLFYEQKTRKCLDRAKQDVIDAVREAALQAIHRACEELLAGLSEHGDRFASGLDTLRNRRLHWRRQRGRALARLRELRSRESLLGAEEEDLAALKTAMHREARACATGVADRIAKDPRKVDEQIQAAIPRAPGKGEPLRALPGWVEREADVARSHCSALLTPVGNPQLELVLSADAPRVLSEGVEEIAGWPDALRRKSRIAHDRGFLLIVAYRDLESPRDLAVVETPHQVARRRTCHGRFGRPGSEATRDGPTVGKPEPAIVRYGHGVEREFQLVDTEGHQRWDRQARDRLLARLRQRLRSHPLCGYVPESAAALELRVGIVERIGELRLHLDGLEEIARACAEEMGLQLMAAGVYPLAARRGRIHTFGEHHHVRVESADEAVDLSNLIRLFIPELILLGANSPFYGGKKARSASMRLARSPHIGLPEPLGAEDVEKVKWLSHEVSMGERRYRDVTPFVDGGRTSVEVRLFDMSPDLRRTQTIAGLLQALQMRYRQIKEEVVGLRRADSRWESTLPENRKRAIEAGWKCELHLKLRPLLPLDERTGGRPAIRAMLNWLAPALEAIEEREKGLSPLVQDGVEELLGSRYSYRSADDFAARMILRRR